MPGDMGFVTFESEETANSVKQQTNLYFMGKMMNVGEAIRKTERLPRPMHGGGGGGAGGGGGGGGGSKAAVLLVIMAST